MYVYQAKLYVPNEPGFDFGLYEKKADAKAACQDDHDNGYEHTPLAWQNSGVLISRSNPRPSGCSYYVTCRRVHTTFKPNKK